MCSERTRLEVELAYFALMDNGLVSDTATSPFLISLRGLKKKKAVAFPLSILLYAWYLEINGVLWYWQSLFITSIIGT
jgi:hypothetical protein